MAILGPKPLLLGLEARSRSLDGLSRPAAGVTRVLSTGLLYLTSVQAPRTLSDYM